MKKINKIVLLVCCFAASAVIFYVNNQRTMVSEVFSSNVEALVSGDGLIERPGYKIEKMYMEVEKGSIPGWCGEYNIDGLRMCINWTQTEENTLHDECYWYDRD